MAKTDPKFCTSCPQLSPNYPFNFLSGETSNATSGQDPKLTVTQNGLSSGDQGSSSGTLEVQDTEEEVQDTEEEVQDTTEETGNEESFADPSDTSFSTMSSDVGSPNLSMSELKESLSETFVKVPTVPMPGGLS